MTTAKEFFPGAYNELGLADQSRLEELAAVSTLLSNTTTLGMQNNVRVRLSHFNFFFPYFFGLKSLGDELVKDDDQLRNMWSACCGSLQHDVDVVEDPHFDNPHAPVLFVFPSYWDSSFLNTNPALLSGESFDAMRRRMESERNFPDNAVNMYLQGTHNRIDSAISSGASKESVAYRQGLYAKILAFYGITPTAGANKANALTSGQNTQGINANTKPFGDFGSF